MEAHLLTGFLSCKTMPRDGLMANGRKKLMSDHALRSLCTLKIDRVTTGKVTPYTKPTAAIENTEARNVLLISGDCMLKLVWQQGLSFYHIYLS